MTQLRRLHSVYRCSCCGHLRRRWQIAEHNIACANSGERSYQGNRPAGYVTHIIPRGTLTTPTQQSFYVGRSGRKLPHLGAA